MGLVVASDLRRSRGSDGEGAVALLDIACRPVAVRRHAKRAGWGVAFLAMTQEVAGYMSP